MGLCLSLLCVLSLFEVFIPETVSAGTFDNAYTFYQAYGSEMAFQSGTYKQGEIYYATKAKKDTTVGIQYTTIGWKVRVFNHAGTVVDTIYYQLGGSNMSAVDVRSVDGYEYCLYKVTLSNMKSRMSTSALNTLATADCSIIFDACTTTKLNGVIQGGMTDNGPSWGKVYTTYDEIVNAQKWSSATKETLKTYYNKTVVGLFYNVTLNKGTGIKQVSGAGKYCFGTTVHIQAITEDGYHFSNWSGAAYSTNSDYSFVLYDNDVTYTANATWDHGPTIEADDIYVSLEDAKNGTITESWLAEYANAADQEDGSISYGENETTSFLLTDYQASDFTYFQKEGYVTETFRATDSAGNTTSKRIKVYIVDTSIYDAEALKGSCRFISSRYFKDEEGNFVEQESGGLDENSIWRLDEEYSGVLDVLFAKINEGIS